MRNFFVIFITFIACLTVQGQNFNQQFKDSTLRIDYIIGGDSAHQQLFLNRVNVMPGWAGRRNHLAEYPLRGNGQIEVRDLNSGKLLYCNSFSSLFLEWQSTSEAAHIARSFENCFLIPKPIQPVSVKLSLFDTHGKVSASITHKLDPHDVLIRHIGERHVTPHQTVYSGGSTDSCVDIAILSEGYKADEMNKFLVDCKNVADAILSSAPFKKNKQHFNFIAVCAPSVDSGVSDPIKCDWKSTAAGAHFDTFYSPRYMTSPDIEKIHDLLAGIPYEQIIVLANSAVYSAGGIYNSIEYAAAHNEHFKAVVVHEFGHSFGGLADEYFYDDQYTTMYPSDTEPWEQNITTLVDFNSKWKDMLPAKTKIPTIANRNPKDIYTKIGVYEGGGYQSKGVYRAFQECRMKTNESPDFCAVCSRAIERMVKFYTE